MPVVVTTICDYTSLLGVTIVYGADDGTLKNVYLRNNLLSQPLKT